LLPFSSANWPRSQSADPEVYGERQRLGAGELLLPRRVLHAAEEQGLVDPPLEDRHPELHALRDDFAAVHTCLPSELGGRQVDRHLCLPPRRLPGVLRRVSAHWAEASEFPQRASIEWPARR